MTLMHEDEVPHWVAPREPEPEPRKPAGPFLVIPASLVERTIEATAPFAHFAGDARMLGLHDAEIVHPILEAGAFRDMRAVRRELLEEYAADDEQAAHGRNLSRRLPVEEPTILVAEASAQAVAELAATAPASPDREALGRAIYAVLPQRRVAIAETLQPTTGLVGHVAMTAAIPWSELPDGQRGRFLAAADAVAALITEEGMDDRG